MTRLIEELVIHVQAEGPQLTGAGGDSARVPRTTV